MFGGRCGFARNTAQRHDPWTVVSSPPSRRGDTVLGSVMPRNGVKSMAGKRSEGVVILNTFGKVGVGKTVELVRSRKDSCGGWETSLR